MPGSKFDRCFRWKRHQVTLTGITFPEFQDRFLKPLGHPSVFRIQALSKTGSSAKEASAPHPAATKPPAEASGTPSKTVWDVVDGAAVVGDDRKRFKTRFPTSMRLSKEEKAYALAAGFDTAKIELMFEIFRNYNLAMRSYSLDWGEVWFNWVDREVDIVTEDYHRGRARAYAAGTSR